MGSTLISLWSSVPSHINAFWVLSPKPYWSSSYSFTYLMLLISQFPAERSLAQRKLPGRLDVCQVSRECPISTRAHDVQTANKSGAGGVPVLHPLQNMLQVNRCLPCLGGFCLPEPTCGEWRNKWKTELMKSCDTGTCRCC